MDENVWEFCHALAALDEGDRARLKRCGGKTLEQAPGSALRVFYELLGKLPSDLSEKHEAVYFRFATLFPLAEGGFKGDFGLVLRRQLRPKNDDEAKGLDRQVQRLLDGRGERLWFLLRRFIHRLGAEQKAVNWPRLLDDLLHWELEKRPVQIRWAKNYFLSEKQSRRRPAEDEAAEN
jgi:CRISPR type I-E-associated protein CasB/Cse2